MIGSIVVLLIALPLQQHPDTIRVGDLRLDSMSMGTGVEMIESFRRMDNGDVERQSATLRTVSRDRIASGDVYVLRLEHRSNDTTFTEIAMRADNFALIHQRVKASRDSAAVTVGEGSVTGWVLLPEQPVSLVDRRLDHPVFPIEGQIPWLFPMLPLEKGYEATIPYYSIWEAGEVWKTIKVIGSESVEYDDRARDCWLVDRGPLGPPGHRAYAWVDKATRRILRTELRAEDGVASFWSESVPNPKY